MADDQPRTAPEQGEDESDRRAGGLWLLSRFSLSSWTTERRRRWGWTLCLVVVVLFGGLVELRSAFLKRRMGDLGVFLRTAWAVRAGADIYTVTDNNGYHYHYPPLFAILIAPLADPPAGAAQSWTVPYPLAVVLWYVLSLVCLVYAVRWLADALPRHPTDYRTALRLVPILACLAPIGHTLMRGQVSLLLLLLLCGALAALLRGRRGQAGLWLAGAICLKVIPAYLLIYPLYRRDGRCLAGCAAGLVVGLVLIPAAVFGPSRTLAYYQEWTEVLVRPGLGTGNDRSRAKELIDVTATDSQSFVAMIHNTVHLDPATRPSQPSIMVRAIHWLLGGLMTAVTLLIARRHEGAAARVITFGALIEIMLLISPVCHLHYFCLSLPLMMGTLAALWAEQRSRVGRGAVYAVLALHAVACTLPHLPGLQLLRDCGLAGQGAILLWLTGLVVLHQTPRLPFAASVAPRPWPEAA